MEKPELFKKIRHIQMRSTQLADHLLAGVWRSAFRGQGLDFEEVREYQTGDDIRLIDWNVTARQQHPFVKVFQEEREITVFLLVDFSASCQFGSSEKSKQDLIAEIAAVLAFSAIKNNDKVGLTLFTNQVEKHIPAKKGTKHVLRTIRELLAFEPKNKKTDITAALRFFAKVQKKTAICFLISDFLSEIPEKLIKQISQKHDLIGLCIQDPYEVKLPDIGTASVKDLETEEHIITNTRSIQEEFEKKAFEHIGNVKKIMKAAAAGFIQIQTDQPYLRPLIKYFKTVKRRALK